MDYNKCNHVELKYFEETNKVVCMKCGKAWDDNKIISSTPTIPYTPISPQPDYPIYPTITWNKIIENKIL